MSQKSRYTWLVILLTVIVAFFAINGIFQQNSNESPEKVVQNIIFFIGDGMGVTHVTTTSIAVNGPDSSLRMEQMQYTGFIKTHSANSLVTDSGAAGTALATGVKTNNGMIAVNPEGKHLTTILEACKKTGMSTGLVATSQISHATPASMGAHVPDRGNQQKIAEQLVENKVDVMLGGGLAYFLPQSHEKSARKDDKDMLAVAKAAGYTIVQSREELLEVEENYVLGVFADQGLTTQPPEPSLAEMTKKAISILSRNEKGFYLMVEGSQIDWAAHDNNQENVIRQTILFDEAIGVAMDFAKEHGNTLIVVTADHETGGMGLNDGWLSGRDLKTGWTTGGHTGSMVPLFACGPQGALFVGVNDNTYIPQTFAKILHIQEFPHVVVE